MLLNKTILFECPEDFPLSRFVGLRGFARSLLKDGNQIVLTGCQTTIDGVLSIAKGDEDFVKDIKCYVPFDKEDDRALLLNKFAQSGGQVNWEAGGKNKNTGQRDINAIKRAVKASDCFIGFIAGFDKRVAYITRTAYSLNKNVYLNPDITVDSKPLDLPKIGNNVWRPTPFALAEDNDLVFWQLFKTDE